jgi:hypothetical protein
MVLSSYTQATLLAQPHNTHSSKMVNPNRRFFVGGNFKMNGTVDMITNLIEHLNNAHLDGKTGA